MNNQLTKHKVSIWKKIKNLFFRLPTKKNTKRENTIVEPIRKSYSQRDVNFEKFIKVSEEDLKVDIKNMSLDTFIDNLEWHPEWIKELSTDRLLKLQEYIEQQIEEYKEKIEKIKKVS